MTSSIETSDTWPMYSLWAEMHFGRGREEGRKEGMTKSRVDSILMVLEARNLDVTTADRERIVRCTDLKQLKTWLRRAVTAEKTSDLFD